MSVKKAFLCCCLFLIPSRETVRFYLLATLILLYMLAGAALFSCLERPAELKAHQLWETRLRIFSKEHNISREALKSLLSYYEEARTAGIHTKRGRALWDIPGAFYFVGTVVSTIGFGVAAPSTAAGRFLLVFYGLLGCSATILFFNLFLERVITFLSLWMLWCRTRGSRQRGQENRLTGNERNDKWKPSVYQVTLILLVAALLLACAAAFLYSAMEGWSYLDSLYFCFVAFSTVGFGDFVSGQRAHYEETWAYKMANCLLMLLGVCCTYSLFNAFAVIIKKVLNWVLSAVNSIYICIQSSGLQFRPLLKLCFSNSEPHASYTEDGTFNGQKLQTQGHTVLWQSCVPHKKCLCDKATDLAYQLAEDSGIDGALSDQFSSTFVK
ncbi:potassium channel subfamily K member 13 [Xenentodon cancila]